MEQQNCWLGPAIPAGLTVTNQEGQWSTNFEQNNYTVLDPSDPLYLTDGGNRTATLRLNASGNPEVFFTFLGGSSVHEWDATTRKFDFWSPPDGFDLDVSPALPEARLAVKRRVPGGFEVAVLNTSIVPVSYTHLRAHET